MAIRVARTPRPKPIEMRTNINRLHSAAGRGRDGAIGFVREVS